MMTNIVHYKESNLIRPAVVGRGTNTIHYDHAVTQE